MNTTHKLTALALALTTVNLIIWASLQGIKSNQTPSVECEPRWKSQIETLNHVQNDTLEVNITDYDLKG